jgi:hypothetical protein
MHLIRAPFTKRALISIVRSPNSSLVQRMQRVRRVSMLLAASATVITGCAGQAPVWSSSSLPFMPITATSQPLRSTSMGAPTTAQRYDYRHLLLQPEDMVRPNQGYSAPEPATLDPAGIPGAEVLLTSDDGSNALGITIVILDQASAAPIELRKAIANLTTVKSTMPPVEVSVGDAAVAVSGITPDGAKSATALMFRYDRAIVRIDFYTPPGVPTPTGTVIDIGQKQTVALRAGLPAIGPIP